MRKETGKNVGTNVRNLISGRSCIHGEEGHTGIPKLCIHNDECWHCPFDQWLGEVEESRNSLDCRNMKTDLLARAA
ncbi:hypothetical protein ACFL9T_01870 [Thermodesulfobacteriota bacterium]